MVNNNSIYYVLIDSAANVHTSTKMIYKIKTNGTEKINLINDSEKTGLCSNLVVYKDWLYYLSDATIYKMKTDGTEITKVSSVKEAIVDFKIVDDWVYYTGSHDPLSFSRDLYKMKIDGTNMASLDETTSQCISLAVAGDWVYYQDNDEIESTNIPYKIKTDGTKKAKVDFK